MGINKIKGCDGEDYVWRLKEKTRSVKLGDAKSSYVAILALGS